MLAFCKITIKLFEPFPFPMLNHSLMEQLHCLGLIILLHASHTCFFSIQYLHSSKVFHLHLFLFTANSIVDGKHSAEELMRWPCLFVVKLLRRFNHPVTISWHRELFQWCHGAVVTSSQNKSLPNLNPICVIMTGNASGQNNMSRAWSVERTRIKYNKYMLIQGRMTWCIWDVQ